MRELCQKALPVRLCLCATASIVLLSSAFPAGSYGLVTPPVPQASAEPLGYPMLLSRGSTGGVWFGGATEGYGRLEAVDRVDYITPAGSFLDFPFPPELWGYWPEAFAPGQDGEEWFLAHREGDPTPLLGEVSPLGQFTVIHLQVPAGSAVDGLAVGADGNLWMTDTRLDRRKRLSAILRVSPGGSVTTFSAGLQRGANPENIAAGPGGVLWFTDRLGRIGRIDMAGTIKEFPVGHTIEGPGVFGPPAPIVAAPDGAVWFVLNGGQLGRMTPTGHVEVFTPPASIVRLLRNEDVEEPEKIEGLAIGPNGEPWFTRKSGAVLRIDSRGHVRTVTNRLVAGRGIAVTSGGEVWVGEEASGQESVEVIPTRVARIDAEGVLTQYPEPPPCRVPFLLGDGPSHATEQLRQNNCELAGVRRPNGSHSNRLIVVAQSVRPDALVGYKTPVRVVLGPKPPPPKTCRAPRYVRVLADSRWLVVWKNPIVEADNAESHGEGPQTYVVCVPGHRAKHVFMSEEFDSGYAATLEALHTAGHFIAFSINSANHYNNDENALVLYNALRGKIVFKASYEFGENSSRAEFSSFALDSTGDVAWVKEEALWATVDNKTVQTGQRDTLVAHYAGHDHPIEATTSLISDLKLRRHVLQWVSDRQTYSRRLP